MKTSTRIQTSALACVSALIVSVPSVVGSLATSEPDARPNSPPTWFRREVQDGDMDMDRPCELECLHSGKCRVSSANDPNAPPHSAPFYCECPQGYGGVTCEEKTRECGVMKVEDEKGTSKKRYCQNGAPCTTTIDTDGMKHHSCRCERAFGTSAFAGEQCEHTATIYCDGGNVQRTTFCTNGGTCVPQNETNASKPHKGCSCPPDFEGQFCEYLKGTMPTSDHGEPVKPASSLATTLIAALIFGLVVAVVLCILYTACRHYRERRADRRMLTAALDTTAELQLDPRGSFMFDDGDGDEGGVAVGVVSSGSSKGVTKETELTRKGGKLYAGNLATTDVDENEII